MIQDQTTKVIYVGNGQTTHFPFKFKYNDKAHIHVAIYDIDTQVQTELTKDFFVDSEKNEVIYPGYQSGQEPPEAQIPPVLQANQKLVIYRQTPLTQEIDFGSKYPLPFVENGTDKNTMISQEMKEALERSVKVDMGSEVKPDELLTDIKQNVADANQSAQNAQQSANEAQEYAQNANANAQSINIRTFQNVESMKQANNLKVGGLIKTQGFYQANDGGGADYVIVDEVDEASVITLQKGLYAKLLIADYVNVKWFGAYGDGTHDDTEAIQKCADFTAKNVILIVFPYGSYITSKQINLSKGARIEGCRSFIKGDLGNKKDFILSFNGDVSNGYVRNLRVWAVNDNALACINLAGIGGDFTIQDCQTAFGKYGVYGDSGESSLNFLRIINLTCTQHMIDGMHLGTQNATSCPITIQDCLIQSCGLTEAHASAGEEVTSCGIYINNVLDVTIIRLQVDNHGHRKIKHLGYFLGVRGLTLIGCDFEDTGDSITTDHALFFGGVNRLRIDLITAWAITTKNLIYLNGCLGDIYIGQIYDQYNVSTWENAVDLGGNYTTGNDGWCRLHYDDDISKLGVGAFRALVDNRLKLINYCSNKNATNKLTFNNKLFTGTITDNGNIPYFANNVKGANKFIVYQKCKYPVDGHTTKARFFLICYDSDYHTLAEYVTVPLGTFTDNIGNQMRLDVWDIPDGTIQIVYGYKPSDYNTSFNFYSDSDFPVIGWSVFLHFNNPVTSKMYWDSKIDRIDNTRATTQPTTGEHKKGEIVYNLEPTNGGYVGWVCTASGTPGTWKGFGLIQS